MASFKDEDRMVSMCVLEADSDQKGMECGIPLMSCLFQSIQAFLELGNLHLIPLFLVSFRLMHVDILCNQSIEVGQLYVHLSDLPAMLSADCQENMEGGGLDDGVGGILVCCKTHLQVLDSRV